MVEKNYDDQDKKPWWSSQEYDLGKSFIEKLLAKLYPNLLYSQIRISEGACEKKAQFQER